jgi:intein/homing endonuclease
MRFNILQYLPSNTKIKINNELRKDLFSGKSITDWSKLFGISLKNASRYINGTRNLPLFIVKKLTKNGENLKKLQHNIELKIEKSGNYLKMGPIIKIDESWVNIGELIRGDGHITPNFWYIHFINNNEILITHVKNFFFSLGIEESQISLIRRKDAFFLTIRSSLLAHLFNKILEIPIGKKGELNIPKFIILNKKLGISAIRGAFDAKGSVTFTGSRRISITSNSKNWLLDIQQILNDLRIESRVSEEKDGRERPIYRILITHKSNLSKFLRIISPLHNKRKEKLKEILTNYTKNPQREFHKKILLFIKKGYFRKKDISSKLKQNLIITGNNINWLKKKGYIMPYEKIYSNKGSFHKYKITDEGDNYLTNSLSFFD